MKELVQLHKDDPFALIGIATDQDKDEYLRRARAEGIAWRNAWAGGTAGTWPTTWGVQRYPTIYVLDAKGVLRAANARGAELARVVKGLVEEARAERPIEPRNGSGGVPPVPR